MVDNKMDGCRSLHLVKIQALFCSDEYVIVNVELLIILRTTRESNHSVNFKYVTDQEVDESRAISSLFGNRFLK